MKARSNSQQRRIEIQKKSTPAKKTILRKKNAKSLSPTAIVEQMTEARPLPIGRTEFDEWSERIISGALVKSDSDCDPEIFKNSQKNVLASMIMCLGPTESHKPDAHFIHGLRMAAIKQTAHTISSEIRENAKLRLAKEEPEIEKAITTKVVA